VFNDDKLTTEKSLRGAGKGQSRKRGVSQTDLCGTQSSLQIRARLGNHSRYGFMRGEGTTAFNILALMITFFGRLAEIAA